MGTENRIGSSGAEAWRYEGSNVITDGSTGAHSFDVWSMVSLVRTTGPTINMHINGNSTPELTSSDDWGFPIDKLKFGAGSDCMICMVGLWNRALDTTELSALYNVGSGLRYNSI